MRWPTIVVGVVIVLVLLPMWAIAIQGEAPTGEVELDHSVSEIRPLDGFVDTPNKLSPSQVGVIVWIALFALFGVLAAAHRFMNEAVRPPDRGAVASGEDARDDPSGRVREWAAHMLAGVGDDEARAALKRTATEDEKGVVRTTAANALQEDPDRFRRSFRSALAEGDTLLPGEDLLNRQPDL